MRGSIRRHRLDCRAKLRNRAIEIARIEQAPSRIRRKECCLFAGLLLRDVRSCAALYSGAFCVTELPQNGSQCRVCAGKLRLQPDPF